jgi:hypothetical protein
VQTLSFVLRNHTERKALKRYYKHKIVSTPLINDKMKTKIFNLVTIVALMTLLASFDYPVGWDISGSRPKSYDMGIDKM